jgi:outer membrane protein assembly factor BamB
MKYLLIFYSLFFFSCSFNKDKKVDLDFFKKQGEKIDIFETTNAFDKEINSNSILQLNAPRLNKNWFFEHFSSNNFYDHFVYEGKFDDIFKKNLGDYIDKKNDSGSLLAFENFIFFSDQKGIIYKFDLTSQKNVWELKVHESSYNSYPKNIALFLNQDFLYGADNLGFIYSIDLETGKIIWKQNYGVPFASHLNFYQDVLYVVNKNSRLYAFSISNGQKIWSFEALSGLVKPSKSSNISINNNKLVFSNDLGDLTVIDLNKQTVLWSINIFSTNRILNNFFSKISNILIDKNNVYVSSSGGDLISFNIENGDINWSKKITSTQNHVVADKYLFALTEDGYVIAFNKSDGNILWSLNLSNSSIDKNKKGKEYFGLILASSNLYVASSNGDIYKISASDGKYISTKKISNELSRAPIIVNNKMLILNHSSELIIIN